MDNEVAARVVEAGEGYGLDLHLSEGYSGRGMFGETTTGVTAPSPACLAAAVGLACRAAEGPEDANDIVETIIRCRQDSMGKGLIFY